MADEAIDHLITKSYDTENLKSTLNEFQLDASKRDQDLLPKLNSMNKSVEQSFSELLKTLNEVKETEERLKGSMDYEDSKLQEIENQVEEEMKLNEKLKQEEIFLQQLKESEEENMERNVKNFTNYLEELASSFEEAPKLNNDEVLRGEIAQLRERADKVQENLAAMQTEISSLKNMFCNSNKDDSNARLECLKNMRNSGDAEFVISWLAQKNNGWKKKNEMVERLIDSDTIISSDRSMT